MNTAHFLRPLRGSSRATEVLRGEKQQQSNRKFKSNSISDSQFLGPAYPRCAARSAHKLKEPCMKTSWAVALCLAMLTFAAHSYSQTQLVSDSFSSGNNGSYLGQNWTGCGYNNGAYTELVYQNDQAGGSGYWGQDCSLYTGYGPFPADQYASATIVAATPSSSPEVSIQLRGNSTPSTPEAYIACGWDAQDFSADYHYRIWSLAQNPPTGGPTSLYLSSLTPATNDVVLCQVLGDTVTMQVNGTTLATVTDTSGLAAGYPGLYYVDPNGSGPSSTDVMFANFVAGSGPPLVSLAINPNSASVVAGSFVQFSGQAVYSDGTTSSLNSWSSSAPSVASVDITGSAFASSAGTTTITGSAGSDSGTAALSVQAPQGYNPLVHDSFLGTGGGYLGSNWVGCGYSGGAYSQLVYQNNAAGGSGYYSQNCSMYTGYGPFPSDQYATAVVVAPTPSSTTEAAVQLRGNATPSSPESYIACGWDAQDFPTDNHYRIWSLPPNPASGGPTSLYLSSVTPAVNDVIWCQVLGSEVTMQVNGTTIATVSDTSGITTGYPGLYYIDLNGDAPPVTDVIFDNFVAGQITGPVIASIALNPASASVLTGSSVQFSATGTYTDGSVSNVTSLVTWSSSNNAVATVSSAGLAYAAGPGTAAITAASGMATSKANMTVTAPITPTVTFTGAPSSAPMNSSFTVTATTNSAVMPTISGTAGVCSVGSVSGTPTNAHALVTMLVGSGTCVTSASWPATTQYAAAGPVTQTTAAANIAATVTFTGAPSSSVYNSSFTVKATTNASTMPQIAGTPNVCTVGAVSGTPANSSASVTMISGTGTCGLTATWAADANYSAPAPKTQNTTATKATSTISITGNSPSPSTLQQPVTFSFKATGTGVGPTGSVTVTANTRESCTSALSSLAGSCSIAFTSSGSRTVAARYAGDNNFNASTSGNVSQSVNAPSVSLSSSSINYGTVTRGSNSTKSVSVTNFGTGALINLSWSITGANANEFKVSSATCTPPATLAFLGSCSVSITFTPNATGTQSATLRFADNASNSPQSVSLTGSGR